MLSAVKPALLIDKSFKLDTAPTVKEDAFTDKFRLLLSEERFPLILTGWPALLIVIFEPIVTGPLKVTEFVPLFG